MKIYFHVQNEIDFHNEITVLPEALSWKYMQY